MMNGVTRAAGPGLLRALSALVHKLRRADAKVMYKAENRLESLMAVQA
jgi:hypothetical protein